MRVVTAIDPGMSTGVSWIRAGDSTRPELLNRIQVSLGLSGTIRFLDTLTHLPQELVVEKFSPRPGARAWRLDELEPIRIEGMLEYRYGSQITWRKPEQRKLVNNSLRETEDFLRWAGLWTLPSDIGMPDANDVNAATMHAIGYLRDQKHIPTIEMLIEYGNLHMEEDS